MYLITSSIRRTGIARRHFPTSPVIQIEQKQNQLLAFKLYGPRSYTKKKLPPTTS